MTATVHNLIEHRVRRGAVPLHFDYDIDALAWIKAELETVRADLAGELLAPAAPIEQRLAQVSAVVSAIAVLYGNDDKETNR